MAVIGLIRGTVALEHHKPEWDTAAEQTIAVLKKVLGSTAADIQHIGSTSVKSICAKPIIDIVVGVSDPAELLGKNDILEEDGFIFRGQDHPGQFLYICGKDNFITHHIHATVYGSEIWNNYVNMRDYLNSHIDDAQDYSRLKEALAQRYPNDRNTYTVMKSGFICELLRKVAEWRNK